MCHNLLEMKKIGIVLPGGAVMPSGVVSTYFLFNEASAFCRSRGQEAPFEVKILGNEQSQPLYDGFVAIHPQCTYEECEPLDLLLIPGFTGMMDEALEINAGLIPWLTAQHQLYGSELASICTGAFLLAKTGLLEGKQCTTHWAYAQDFRERFPQVQLLPEKIVTDEGGLYSSAGAYSALNLVLYLVEKFCNFEVAWWLSRVYQIDIRRDSQQPFVLFNLQKNHGDLAISKAQAYIEQNYSLPLTIYDLARQFAFSRRNFIRRFKLATGNTPLEYLQRIRIEVAKRLLETTRQSIEEVIFSSGYLDGKNFRKLFKKYTGYSPLAYRERYAKQPAN